MSRNHFFYPKPDHSRLPDALLAVGFVLAMGFVLVAAHNHTNQPEAVEWTLK